VRITESELDVAAMQYADTLVGDPSPFGHGDIVDAFKAGVRWWSGQPGWQPSLTEQLFSLQMGKSVERIDPPDMPEPLPNSGSTASDGGPELDEDSKDGDKQR
jgi:hypothetical protein